MGARGGVTGEEGHQEGWITKGHQQTLGGDGNVYCLDCGVGFHIYVYTHVCQSISDCTF